MQPRAVSLVREAPHYRSDAVLAGLKAAGFKLFTAIHDPKPTDLLVCWNRYDFYNQIAAGFEAAGATVIIMENGIIGATENAHAKQFDRAGEQLFTLALDLHNGAGRWWIGPPGRWRDQGIEVKPWRVSGEHVLVLPQRGFGHPKVAPPPGWLDRTVSWLKARTYREIRVRPHPGNEPARKPLAEDLHNCWCCVTWGSGAAIKAMCAGVRCYSNWPTWIGNPAALPLDQIGLDIKPSDVSRETMLNRVSWAQWSVPELAAGEPFEKLLLLADEAKLVA
jgi:hypothetical protein